MSLPPFHYLAPQSTDELVGMLAKHGAKARVLAGGTDLINWMGEKIVHPDYLIDLNSLASLYEIMVRSSTRSNSRGSALSTPGTSLKIDTSSAPRQ